MPRGVITPAPCYAGPQALGASEVTPRGEGDDDRDIDADFDQWSGQLFAALDGSDLVTASKVCSPAWRRGGLQGLVWGH